MEQTTVTIYGGEMAIYEQVTAWIQIDNPMSWRGHLIATEGQLFATSGLNTVHPVRFFLKTVEGHGGEVIIDTVNTQTREVHFEGRGRFGPLQ